MFHRNRGYIETLEAERRDTASRRRPPVGVTDLARVVRAASAGDAAAWSALLERFTARLRAVAHAHQLSAHDAEDVAQTTWLRLLEHIDAVKEPDAIGAWLETTARRESLRVIRSARRERPVDDSELPAETVDPVAERRLAAADDGAALARALKRLPVQQQRTLAALFAEPPRSYEELSRTLSMPIGSLGPTRARGLARLRRDHDLLAAVARVV
jgi:RNA polymerase sigma factor (sigma-70 family)